MAKRHRHSSISIKEASHNPDNASQSGPQDGMNDSDISASKVQHTDGQPRTSKIYCDLPPHTPLPFASYDEYEIHYNKTHCNRCLECHRNLPTDHFLSLHIAENHDPIVATRKDRGEKTYACFVEDCDKVCATWEKRRLHLEDKHMFPRNYDFLIVNTGLDGRRSMLRQGRGSPVQRRAQPKRVESDHDAMSVETASTTSDSAAAVMTPVSSDEQMDALTTGMSSLKFIPNSVRFGRRKGLSGFSKN